LRGSANARPRWGALARRGDRIPKRTRLTLALGANQLLSSGTHLIAKAALLRLSPLAVALLRFVSASTVLLGYLRLTGGGRVERRDWPAFLLLGFLVVPVNQGCFLFGLSRSTASHASLLYALTPLVVLLFARRLLREEGLVAKLVGILAAFAGVAVILLERGLRHEVGLLSGDLLILVAVFSWAGYTVLSKRLLARYDPMTVTGWSIISGTLLCLPALLIPGAIPPLRSIPAGAWGAIAYLSVGTSVIAYPLWSYALRHMDASKVAITTNTQPILTAVLSWLLFRERFTPGFFVGAALILAGVTWVETRRPSVARATVVPVEAG
jgi:drug/metabolite transporter (DMT)-like permease